MLSVSLIFHHVMLIKRKTGSAKLSDLLIKTENIKTKKHLLKSNLLIKKTTENAVLLLVTRSSLKW